MVGIGMAPGQRQLVGIVACSISLCIAAGPQSLPRVAQGQTVSSSPVTADQIVAAWRKRESAIRNVKARLAVDVDAKPEHFPHGGRLALGTDAARQSLEASYSRVETILLDFENRRQRYEKEGGIYAANLGVVAQDKQIATFINGEMKSLWDTPRAAETPGAHVDQHGKPPRYQGTIGGRKEFVAEEPTASTGPPLAYVRPFGLGSAAVSNGSGTGVFRNNKLRVIGVTRTAGPSALVECIPEEGAADPRVWLDVERGFVLVRSSATSGRRTWQMTIEYGPDKGFGPVPSRWTAVELQDGAVTAVIATSVIELEFNIAMDDSMFQLEFPRGTVVEGFRGAHRRTLVAQGDGRLLPETPIEAGSRSGWIRVWMITANVTVAIVLLAFLLRRQLRRAS